MCNACRYNHLDIMKWLYNNGAKDDVTKASNYGYTPMYIASQKGHLDIMKCLNENGGKDDVTKARNDGYKTTILKT